MVVTLMGRIQTRILVLAIIGGLWTLLITPILPGADVPEAYGTTFVVLLTVIVLGVGWELLYHGLQQFRWEKDWPTFFGLITAVNEGLLVWILLATGTVDTNTPISGLAFFLHFTSVWLITWLWVNGPMRVPSIRWRFQGGRLI